MSFQLMVCSLPPEPITSTFKITALWSVYFEDLFFLDPEESFALESLATFFFSLPGDSEFLPFFLGP